MLQRFEKFTQCISKAYKYVGKLKSDYMSKFELKGSHVMCLFFLGRNPGGLKASELCELCQEDKAAVSKTLSSLKKKGLVESTAGRLRKYRAIYTITEAGHEIYCRITEAIERTVEKCSKDLTPEEREVFYKTFDKILSNLKMITVSA